MGRTAVIGMFDGVHLGHRFLLDFAKDTSPAGANQVLAVTFRNHPLETIDPTRAPRLLTVTNEKADLLEAAGAQPVILQFDNELRSLTAEQFILRLKHDHDIDRLVIGFNNRFGSDRHLTFDDYRDIGRTHGIEVIQAPEAPMAGDVHISSSAIRNLLNDGKIAEANALLGYEYSITGTVVSGNRIGRTIGFPTANLSLADPRKLIPAPGVYAARAKLSEKDYIAIVNIGHRPTVDNTPALQIEAHIHGLDADIYGESLTLSFHARLRDERRFTDLTALRSQLATDLATALNL